MAESLEKSAVKEPPLDFYQVYEISDNSDYATDFTDLCSDSINIMDRETKNRAHEISGSVETSVSDCDNLFHDRIDVMNKECNSDKVQQSTGTNLNKEWFPIEEIIPQRNNDSVLVKDQNITNKEDSNDFTGNDSSNTINDDNQGNDSDDRKYEKIISYKCLKCHVIFTSKSSFKQHLCKTVLSGGNTEKVNSASNPFKCSKCDKLFVKEDDLNVHERQEFCTNKSTCDICAKTFETFKVLMKQYKSHSCDCDISDLIIRSKAELKSLQNTHTSDCEFSCEICDKTFKQQSSLYYHYNTHFELRKYVCDICSETFISKEHLQDHALIHKVVKKDSLGQDDHIHSQSDNDCSEKAYLNQCDKCDKLFMDDVTLKLHQKNVHRVGKMFHCSVCGKSFHRRRYLQCHEHRHFGGDKYKCEDCGKTFGIKSIFNKHCRTHTGKRNETCNVCGRKFRTKSQLRVHESVHSENKPFFCEVCGARFKQQSGLYHHSSVHSKENKYVCEQCGKGFTRKCRLLEHDKVHQTKEGSMQKDLPCSQSDVNVSIELNEDTENDQLENIYNNDSLPNRSISCPVKAEINSTSEAEDGILEFSGLSTINEVSEVQNHVNTQDIKMRENATCSQPTIKENLNISMENEFSINKQENEEVAIDHVQTLSGSSKLAKRFLCEVCEKSYSTKKGLKRHVCKGKLTDDDPGNLQCSLCNKSFKTKYNLMQHQKIHEGLKPYKCKICERGFLRRRELIHHEYRHYGGNDFNCDKCGKAFGLLALLNKHKLIHSAEKNFICKYCGAGFRTRSQLLGHEIKHTNERPYSCEVCGQDFKQKSALYYHSNVHLTEKKFICNECGKGFNRKSHLQAHYLIHKVVNNNVADSSDNNQSETNKSLTAKMLNVVDHVETESKEANRISKFFREDTFPCDKCTKIFIDNESLHLHKKLTHSSNKTFTCSECGKVFQKKRDLTHHEHKHFGGNKFTCEKCGKTFGILSIFNKHCKTHSEVKNYACHYCDRRFRTNTQLKAHLSTHLDDRPFACEVCGKGFKQKSALFHHRNVHTAEKRFCCEVCGKGFNRKYHLNEHSKTHQMKE